MEVLLFLLALAGLAAFLVAKRQLSVLSSSLLVVLIGTTFGHSFFNISIGPLPLTIDRVLLALLLLASLALWKMGRNEPKPFNRTDIVVLLLTALLIASTLLHDWQYKDNLPLSRLLFFNLLPISLYFVVKHCRIDTGNLRVFYTTLFLFGAYLASMAIFEQRGLYGLVFPRFIVNPDYYEFLGRARGPFLNPVSCGIYLSVCMVSSAMLWKKAGPPGRMILGFVMAACLVASVLTLTRSVWVGCALSVGLVLWMPSRPQVRGALVVAGSLLLMVAAITLADKVGRFQRDKDVTEAEMAQSAKLRPMLAYVAVKMAKDKPIFGHGFGQYTRAKRPYHYHQTNGMQLSLILPYMQHNVILSYLTETGGVGCALLCLLLGTLFLKSWQLWNTTSLSLEARQFGLLGLVVLGNYTLNGLFHDVSIIPHLNALLYLTLGVVENLHVSRSAASGEIATDPEQESEIVLPQAA